VVEWRFFMSAQTGKIGPSSPLMKDLMKNGFDVVFH